jgi:hypothetical protein
MSPDSSQLFKTVPISQDKVTVPPSLKESEQAQLIQLRYELTFSLHIKTPIEKVGMKTIQFVVLLLLAPRIYFDLPRF